MHYLWDGQALDDLLYCIVGISYALTALLLLTIPGLIRKAISVYKHQRQDKALLLYIGRFLPVKLFILWLNVLNALTTVSVTLLLTERWSLIVQPHTYSTLSLLIIGALLLCLMLQYGRSAAFKLWGYLFPQLHQASQGIRQDLCSLSIQVAMLKVLLLPALLMLSNPITIAAIVILLCMLVISLRSWMILHRSQTTSGRSYAVFLYLCTCEFAPYLYLWVLIQHVATAV